MPIMVAPTINTFFGFSAVFTLFPHTKETALFESTAHPRPLDYSNCDKINFNPPRFVTCVCLEGTWALRGPNSDSLSQWTVTDSNNNTCAHLDQWVSTAIKVSNKTNVAAFTALGEYSAIVLNKEDWEVSYGAHEKGMCYAGAPSAHQYCMYHFRPNAEAVSQGCSEGAKVAKEIECERVGVGESEYGASGCTLVQRRKRSNEDDEEKEQEPHDVKDGDFDEDAWSPAELKNLKGHKDLKRAVKVYITQAVENLVRDSTLAAINPGKKSQVKRKRIKPSPPAQHLLELCIYIAQRLCSPVDPQSFEIALKSFLQVQKHEYFLREAFIDFNAYQRSVNSLEKCRASAHAFMFINNDTDCYTGLPLKSTDSILYDGVTKQLRPLPDFAVAMPGQYDPIVETVWKALVMTHSYCFAYFSDYYNDHHDFTSAMVHFFSNKMHGVWQKQRGSRLNKGKDKPPGGQPPPSSPAEPPSPPKAAASPASHDESPTSSPAIHHGREEIWYGGFLGNIGTLFANLDHCYQASRLGPAPYNPSNIYPWYMTRPSRDYERDWVGRRKRSVGVSSSYDEGSCGA